MGENIVDISKADLMPDAARLVRFKCISLDDAPQDGNVDQLVFDAFIDAKSKIVSDQEMLGYELYSVGQKKEIRIGLLRLQPDLSYLFEVIAIDGAGGKTKQKTHQGQISDQIEVKLDTEFEVYIDDVYTYKIVEIIDLVPANQNAASAL